MIDGYIIEGKRFLRGDEKHYNITSDIVFTSLSDAIEEGRKIFKQYFDILSGREYYYADGGNPIDEYDGFNEETLSFYAHNTSCCYVRVNIRKVSIKPGNKKLEETNND